MSDEVEIPFFVIETKEERSDLPSVFVLPKTTNHHVDRASVFDLDHCPFARLVDKFSFLGDDPVATGRLELVKPAAGDFLLGRLRR